MPDDTQRLDWLLTHEITRDHDRAGEYQIIWYGIVEHVVQRRISRGYSYRECIDNAIAGIFERIC